MAEQIYSIKPIGFVRNSNGDTRLEIDKDFAPALKGLEGYSHIMVVFWCHLVDAAKYRDQRIFDKPYAKGPERVGVFATRSPVRPNPVALTPVQVIALEAAEGMIRIPFIDADDGTPIVDLKPYSPSIDRVKEAGTPEWCAHWPKWYEDSASFNWESEFNF